VSRSNCTFKQTDVTRAVKAVVAAGVEVARIEIDKAGKIVILAGKPGESNSAGVNEWDEIGDGTASAAVR